MRIMVDARLPSKGTNSPTDLLLDFILQVINRQDANATTLV